MCIEKLGKSILALLFVVTIMESEADVPDVDEECITVEYWMFSGNPRPRFQICTSGEKAEVVGRLGGVWEEKPASQPVPDLESTPEFQGVLVFIPSIGKKAPTRTFIRKGLVLGGKKTYLDRGRTLERYFVSLGRNKQNISRKDEEESMNPLTESILSGWDESGK